MISSGHYGPKLENNYNIQNGDNCLFFDPEPALLPFGALDYNGLWSFPEVDPSVFPPMMGGVTTYSQLDYHLQDEFDDISGDLCLWDFDQQAYPNAINPNPNPSHQIGNTVNNNCGDEDACYGSTGLVQTHYLHWTDNNSRDQISCSRSSGRKKSSALKAEDIQKYFDVPITVAAKELNVGLTVLKKRCRELNIMRWPHRKIKSLKSLISNVKELGMSNEIEMLEEHKRMVETIPQMELTERTKKLRQACFKANYKKRKLSSRLCQDNNL